MNAQIPERETDPRFTSKVLFIALIVALIAAIYTIAPVFILAFGGIIVAAALNNIATPIARQLHIPHKLALAIATLGLIFAVVSFFVAFGAQAGERFTQLATQLPHAWTTARNWLDSFPSGRYALTLIDSLPTDASSKLLSALPFAGGFAGGVVGWLANAAFILVIGVYLAADSQTYIEGALALFGPAHRKRARKIMYAAGEDLRRWLVAMTFDMIFLGVAVSVGLWAIGVPFPFALGTLSGVAVFVPYIGPILSMVPGLLIALSVNPELALYATAIYVVALQLEGNVALPLLQGWTVHMPPVVSLLSIVGFGLLFGLWGVLLATPLAVVTLTIVRMAYVEGILQEK